jgi:hypothetical protein
MAPLRCNPCNLIWGSAYVAKKHLGYKLLLETNFTQTMCQFADVVSICPSVGPAWAINHIFHTLQKHLQVLPHPSTISGTDAALLSKINIGRTIHHRNQYRPLPSV